LSNTTHNLLSRRNADAATSCDHLNVKIDLSISSSKFISKPSTLLSALLFSSSGILFSFR
jgi:hypothetical protein